jgi:hypothetical protein
MDLPKDLGFKFDCIACKNKTYTRHGKGDVTLKETKTTM